MNYETNAGKSKWYSHLVRLSGLVFFAVLVWNMYWIATHGNFASIGASIFSIAFMFAIGLITANGILTIINNWNYKEVTPSLWPDTEQKPTVAIIIPTYGEPLKIILNTIKSVAEQNWPNQKRLIIVSDDGRRSWVRSAVKKYKLENKDFNILYFTPPQQGHTKRLGDAKSGNLNAALRYIIKKFPYVQYVETRDADDLLGTPDFLSYCVNHLVEHPEISFVQTIKESVTHPADPFSNNESVFYRSTMPAKNAVNSAFPCGSGLVWRMSELKRLKGFPTWNLVEDLQSGFEILRIGGVGEYLPIVGAVAQIAPEDIPNFYKQRGTWALDSMRLFFWKNPFFTRGLSIWQKLQFLELEFSYALSFAMIIFIVSLVLNLVFNMFPTIDNPESFVRHFILFALSMEIFNILKAREMPYSAINRTRQIWLGLMPVFLVACVKALFHGPSQKPAYKVTRKYHEIAWYWRETLAHKLIVSVLTLSLAYNILYVNHGVMTVNAIAIFWSIFFIYNFARTIKNSWHGINVRKALYEKMPVIDLDELRQKTIGLARMSLF